MRKKNLSFLIVLLFVLVLGASSVAAQGVNDPLDVPVITPVSSSDGAGRFYPEAFSMNVNVRLFETENFWVYIQNKLDGTPYGNGGESTVIVRKADGYRVCRVGNPTGFSAMSVYEVSGVPVVVESKTFGSVTEYRVVTPSANQLAHSAANGDVRQLNQNFICGAQTSPTLSNPNAPLNCAILPRSTSDGAGCFYPELFVRPGNNSNYVNVRGYETSNFLVYVQNQNNGLPFGNGGQITAIVRKTDSFRVCRTSSTTFGFSAVGAYEVGGVPFVIEMNHVGAIRIVTPSDVQLNHSLMNGFSRQRNQGFLCPV